jgi:hypothetical protein
MTKDEGSKEGTGDYGSDCEAESEPHGTATLLRYILSAAVKLLSEKCLLHKYSLCRILADLLVKDIPTVIAHTRVLYE